MSAIHLVPNASLEDVVRDAEARYIAANPKSQERFETARRSMPGGNTRTVLHYAPFPLTLAGGEGCRVTDIDAHTYVDFLGEYSAGLYGHSHPRIKAALEKTIASGLTLGGPNMLEAELASLMCARFPSLERVRFCNSGTEANLYAISAARMATGRSAVMVMNGAYHGGVFYFGEKKPPTNAPFPYVIARYNDIETTIGLVDKHAHELAAIVLEPMIAQGGIAADKDFLVALREAATKHGIVLIFDEVMTSRLSPGGLQAATGVTPDMTSFGKYLGGGMSFGAFGGRADIMARFDPTQPNSVSHSGTFNNNVLSMAAGVVGLRDIYTPHVATSMNAAADQFRARLNAIAGRSGVPLTVRGVGSIMTVHLRPGEMRRPEDMWPKSPEEDKRDNGLRTLFHLDMLARGQYLARRGFMAMSLPIGEREMAGFEAAVEEFLALRGPVVRQALGV